MYLFTPDFKFIKSIFILCLAFVHFVPVLAIFSLSPGTGISTCLPVRKMSSPIQITFRHIYLSHKCTPSLLGGRLKRKGFRNSTGLFEMIVGVLTTATSFSRCNSMWFLSMGLRQRWGLCSSSSGKYPGTEGTNQNRHWNYHRWHATKCLEWILYIWVRASWIKFNNCPTRYDLFSLLHYCRQLYMFRVLTSIIRSWYSYKYSFGYWLTGSTTIRFRCWVGTDSCVSYGTYSFVMEELWRKNGVDG